MSRFYLAIAFVVRLCHYNRDQYVADLPPMGLESSSQKPALLLPTSGHRFRPRYNKIINIAWTSSSRRSFSPATSKAVQQKGAFPNLAAGFVYETTRHLSHQSLEVAGWLVAGTNLSNRRFEDTKDRLTKWRLGDISPGHGGHAEESWMEFNLIASR